MLGINGTEKPRAHEPKKKGFNWEAEQLHDFVLFAVAPLAVFRGFAGWLVLALEFLLAADTLKSAISPT